MATNANNIMIGAATVSVGGSDIGFRGFVDWMAKDPNGRLWVIDWKTTGSFQTPEDKETDKQMALYGEAANRFLGAAVAGVAHVQIRNKPLNEEPVRPGEKSHEDIDA